MRKGCFFKYLPQTVSRCPQKEDCTNVCADILLLMWWALLHRGRSERFCVEHRGLQKTLAEEAVSNADAKSENSEVPLRSMSCNLMPTPMISDNPDLVTQREASGKLSFRDSVGGPFW